MTYKLYYAKGNSNLGDAVNPDIFQKVLGIKTRTSLWYNADIYGIGSILHKAFIYKKNNNFLRNIWRNRFKSSCQFFNNKNTYIFGSGFIREYNNQLFPYKNLNVLAVRGKNTLNILENFNYFNLNKTALGDPGLFMSDLIIRPVRKKNYIGIIPHYIDSKSPLLESLNKYNDNIIIIDILGDPLLILQKIASCEFILSSAMHGLIAADSFGIPNKWIVLSNKISGDRFKFDDYYSSYGIKVEPWDITKENNFKINTDKINSSYMVTEDSVKKIKNNLKTTFNNFILEGD